MTLTKVFLRWYRSFNVNYNHYPDRRPQPHPWNALTIDQKSSISYPFIEIPIEPDITTIVGANESGKSHLLDAISKLITGNGLQPESSYERIDLCHFAPVHNKNASAWPHIGIQFELANKEELDVISKAASTAPPVMAGETSSCTMILAPGEGSTYSYIFLGSNESPIPLDKAKTNQLRLHLPEVKFLHSELAIADQISLEALLAAYGDKEFVEHRSFDSEYAQETTKKLQLLELKKFEGGNAPQLLEELKKLQKSPRFAWSEERGNAQLELLLFRDVLGISLDTLQHVHHQGSKNRGYVEGLVAEWNREIENVLNLSYYWQQDEEFVLRINYKDRHIYFEISDRTGSIYTFAERSSGLRYFLSYYIQAKALEKTITGQRPLIIIMDEPDSFLSTVGQRNMLQVFESLVSKDASLRPTQIIYSTHSPFLIHRNFPRRIRLLRKGDAEEGSQYLDESRVRRYEPVRSALGIDCAQTLLMGAQNVVMEGPTDQFLFSELIRIFSNARNAGEFLDMNQVVLLSGESASGIEKLVRASAWGDEVIPTTVVVVDNDPAGHITRDKLTGAARGEPKLLDDSMVCLVNSLFDAKGQAVVSSEDLVPTAIYEEALKRYIKRWNKETYEASASRIKLGASLAGNVAASQAVLQEIFAPTGAALDKMGIAMQVIELVADGLPGEMPLSESIVELGRRVKEMCRNIKLRLNEGQKAERQRSGKQAVQRIIGDFMKIRRFGTNIVDLEGLCLRLRREAKFSFGQEGEVLEHIMDRWSTRLQDTRSAGQTEFRDGEWEVWRGAIEAVKKNPLKPEELAALQVLGDAAAKESKTAAEAGAVKG